MSADALLGMGTNGYGLDLRMGDVRARLAGVASEELFPTLAPSVGRCDVNDARDERSRRPTDGRSRRTCRRCGHPPADLRDAHGHAIETLIW